MATYLDLVGKLEQGKVHKLTWLCGDQPVLTEEAITAIRLTLDAEEMNVTTLFAGQDSVADVWAAMSQHAIDPTQPRLVTVRNADRLGKSLEKLEPWLAGAKYAAVHVTMVSDRPEWKPDLMPEVRKKVVGSASSLYVECRLPKGDPQTAAARIAAESWTPHLSVELATLLAKRTGCNLARMRDVCQWLNSLIASNPSWKVTDRVIESLASETPTEGFADCLTRLDKPAAMAYAADLDPQERRAALIRLQRNLTNLEALNRSMKPALLKYGNDRTKIKHVIQDAAVAAGVPRHEAAWLWDQAKHYDGQAVSRRTEALIRADSNRTNIGAMESLVTEW